ncbi:hypothetical protein H2199_007092 [Coniosporium tulheliwenetii]|uniref:Uncharacterized protein n=1 Tax=Coniosporium tulheliwenetii TaxID=3383036 RepID=A0ACC2YT21_9PEZI|nr:hypothetical protein H2199_007092 [Cladosporium sp. JES 115]
MSDQRASTSTNSANAFPLPSGAPLTVPEHDDGQLSPAKSAFSYESQPKSPMPSAIEFDRKEITREIERGAPGDRKGNAAGQQNSKRKTQYYEEQFAYKDDTSQRRADPSERTFLAPLEPISKTPSLIMIFVQHSALLCLGGTFDPAYLLTITALPVQVQSVTNKRNAAMIQSFMSDLLNVASDRGVIRFEAIPEENLAINGKTILGEVERLEKQQAEENNGPLKRALTKSSRKSIISRKDSPQLSRKSSLKPERDRTLSPPLSPRPDVIPESAPSAKDGGFTHRKGYLLELSPGDAKVNGPPQPTSSHGLKGKKSSPGVLQNYSHLTPPPIPQDAPASKMSKRKSFVSIFKKF